MREWVIDHVIVSHRKYVATESHEAQYNDALRQVNGFRFPQRQALVDLAEFVSYYFP